MMSFPGTEAALAALWTAAPAETWQDSWHQSCRLIDAVWNDVATEEALLAERPGQSSDLPELAVVDRRAGPKAVPCDARRLFVLKLNPGSNGRFDETQMWEQPWWPIGPSDPPAVRKMLVDQTWLSDQPGHTSNNITTWRRVRDRIATTQSGDLVVAFHTDRYTTHEGGRDPWDVPEQSAVGLLQAYPVTVPTRAPEFNGSWHADASDGVYRRVALWPVKRYDEPLRWDKASRERAGAAADEPAFSKNVYDGYWDLTHRASIDLLAASSLSLGVLQMRDDRRLRHHIRGAALRPLPRLREYLATAAARTAHIRSIERIGEEVVTRFFQRLGMSWTARKALWGEGHDIYAEPKGGQLVRIAAHTYGPTRVEIKARTGPALPAIRHTQWEQARRSYEGESGDAFELHLVHVDGTGKPIELRVFSAEQVVQLWTPNHHLVPLADAKPPRKASLTGSMKPFVVPVDRWR